MLSYKPTTLIIYPAGGYGTFIDWCLSYFSGYIDYPKLPFELAGSSHRHVGRPLDFTFPKFTTDDYLKSSEIYKFARTHAVKKDMSLQQYYEKYADYFQNIIVLAPSDSVILLLVKNSIDKIPSHKNKCLLEWIEIGKQHFQLDFNQTTLGIQREIISFWFSLDPALQSIFKLDNIKPHTIKFDVEEFVNNPKQILKDIFKFLKLEIVSDRQQELDNAIQQWDLLQIHKDTDAICNNIINHIVSNTEFDWSTQTLDIIEQAYIQWQLRVLHGINLKCYNLEVFPTNTKDLRNIIDD